MEDKMIVDLYWERSEAAIAETEKKYGKYCHTVASRILQSEEDAAECVNDTYLAAWNAMPPHKPQKLSTFLGKLTRNLALNRYFHDHAEKRFAPTELILHELEEILPDPASEDVADELALKDAINGFLATLPWQTRVIFVRRYWHLSDIKEIARDLGLTAGNVKVILHRTRLQFKAYLEKEGIEL